ncbi:MAG: site-specific DNA-methyltransferase [Gloeomargarita sp. SKYG98]|nr:site-specific DNA-methyltransferase [Gloeomargarita sp. SKYG98]
MNKRKIRAKDAVNTVWWLSKTDFPKADVTRVLVPYSERMQLLLQDSDNYYSPRKRPSGHSISSRFAQDKGGAIPANLLQIPNTESNSQYLRCCRMVGIPAHPARFPGKLPEFFIRFLTDAGDTILDPFAGSNTTGAVAETLQRKWMAFEINQPYLAASAFRFLNDPQKDFVKFLYSKLIGDSARQVRVPQKISHQV